MSDESEIKQVRLAEAARGAITEAKQLEKENVWKACYLGL